MFGNDIGMSFGVEKCAALKMKKGKMANIDEITLPNKTTIKVLKEGDSYKYLRVIRTDRMKNREMNRKKVK